jgi:hypothetical protein
MERKNTDIEPTAADTVSNWRRAKPAAPSEPEPSPAGLYLLVLSPAYAEFVEKRN